MILIIAEKRSVAKGVAESILNPGTLNWKAAYVEGHSQGEKAQRIRITWLNGHIVGLYEPHEYLRQWNKWKLEHLPISPPGMEFRYKVTDEERFADIAKLVSDDVDELVNACDAGREGELIFRETLDVLARNQEIPSNVTRMWIESTTPGGLFDAWALRRKADQAKFNRLAEAAYRRSYADWLLGINMTRYATIGLDINEETIHVGRVQTPVLGAIVHRDYEISHFRRTPYYRVSIAFETERKHFKADIIAPEDEMFGTSPTMFKKLDAARRFERTVNSGAAHWDAIDLTEDHIHSSPEPFDLIDLQRTCARIYQWPPDHTLSVAQDAYLNEKTITYPRTENSDIPEGMKEYASSLHKKIWDFWIARYFNDTEGLYPSEYNFQHFKKSVPDHHGIIPTLTRPVATDDNGDIKDTYRLWELVTKRFILSMLPPMEYTSVRRMMEFPGEDELQAVALGEIVTDVGWMALEEIIGNTRGYGITLAQLAERQLPPLYENRARRVSCSTRQRFTDPPRPYTDDTLLETMGRLKLGTAATRAELIKKLVKNDYIDRDKRGRYDSTAFGREVVKRLRAQGAGDLTRHGLASYWEDQLIKVEKGRPPQERAQFLEAVLNKTVEMGLKLNGLEASDVKVLCPMTGEEVVKRADGYIFAGYPDMVFPLVFRSKEMEASEYRDIIVGKRSGAVLEFMSKKKHAPYRARVCFRPIKKELTFKPLFRGSRRS